VSSALLLDDDERLEIVVLVIFGEGSVTVDAMQWCRVAVLLVAAAKSAVVDGSSSKSRVYAFNVSVGHGCRSSTRLASPRK
jgi:hypothetical protein